jgi:predicted metal-binding protein
LTDKALAAILERLGETALECGFSRTGVFDAAAVRLRQEVRDACAADKCRAYGKNWSCPPACGSLEEWEKRIREYRAGLLLQTTGALEDSFDHESMEKLGAEHNARLRSFRDKLVTVFPDGRNRLLLGSGGCKNCAQCTYPAPCAFPEKMIVSVEAAGIVVSELCKLCNIPYYFGPNTLTYTGCVLI